LVFPQALGDGVNILRDWFRRHFTDPQIVILVILLVIGTGVILTLGRILTPVLASVVIAYLLDGFVGSLERLHLPRLAGVLIVFLIFMAFLLFLLFGLLPLLSRQIGQVLVDLPSMISRGQEELMRLPDRYPDFISKDQILTLTAILQTELGNLGKKLLSFSVASVRGVVTFLVYLVLMPLMVFFFLKDKTKILRWLSSFLPKNRSLSNQVWHEVNQQIGNYTRGKFWEILIVWSASYFTFFLLDLRFAMLLGLIVGLSVLVPYIGVTVVIFPVGIMAFLQWGWGSQFVSVIIAYAVIQLLDGNLLAPLLLSEVVNIHPVAIMVAVLVFGGIWGFWGVFFAIPLATLVHAVIRAWTHRSDSNIPVDASPSNPE
jgi:putative permease